MSSEPLPPLPPVPGTAAAPVLPESSDLLLIVACHLSIFFGMGFLLPLIIFLVKRRDSVLVAEHAKEVLNFHLSLIFFGILSFLLCFVLIGFLLLPVVAAIALICPIMAAIRAGEGRFFRYPLTIRLF